MVSSGDRRILFRLGLAPDPQAQGILNAFAKQAEQTQSRINAAMRVQNNLPLAGVPAGHDQELAKAADSYRGLSSELQEAKKHADALSQSFTAAADSAEASGKRIAEVYRQLSQAAVSYRREVEAAAAAEGNLGGVVPGAAPSPSPTTRKASSPATDALEKEARAAEKFQAKLEEERERALAKIEAQFAKEEAAKQAQLESMLAKEEKYHADLAKQKEKALAKQEKADIAYWAGEARRIDKAIAEAETAESELEASQSALRDSLGGATEGVMKLVRGFALAGLAGEQDSKKILDGLLKVQAAFDVVTGGIEIYQKLSRAVEAYKAAVEAAAAAETAAAAARALGGATSVGRAASVAGGAVTAAGGAAAVPGLAGLLSAAAPVAAFVAAVGGSVAALGVLGEAVSGSATKVGSWSDKIASAEARLADKLGFNTTGDKQFDEFQKRNAKNKSQQQTRDQLTAIDFQREAAIADAARATRKERSATDREFGFDRLQQQDPLAYARQNLANNPFQQFTAPDLVNKGQMKDEGRRTEYVEDTRKLVELDQERREIEFALAENARKKVEAELAGFQSTQQYLEREQELRGQLVQATKAEAAASQQMRAHNIEAAKKELQLALDKLKVAKEAAATARETYGDVVAKLADIDPLKQKSLANARKKLFAGEEITKEEAGLVREYADEKGEMALKDRDRKRGERNRANGLEDFGEMERQEVTNQRGRAVVIGGEVRERQAALANYGKINITSDNKIELNVNFDSQFAETVMKKVDAAFRSKLEALERKIDAGFNEQAQQIQKQAEESRKQASLQLRSSNILREQGLA